MTATESRSPESFPRFDPGLRRRHVVVHRLAHLQGRLPLLQLVLLAAIYLYGALSIGGFASWAAAKLMLVLASITGLAAAGQTVVILMGGFDLSIAGFVVAGPLFVLQVGPRYGLAFGAATAVAAGAAGLLGAISGQVCHRFKIQPLIVTLAMGAVAVGLVEVQTIGGAGYAPGGSAPLWLSRLTSPGASMLGTGIPPVVGIWLAVIVILAVVVHRTSLGRRILATGANPDAAEYSLINTRRVWTATFAFSAMASVLVGLLVAGFSGSITLTSGDPYLFQSVVAVVVGGTVFGGPGDYTRTALGALFLTVVDVVLVGHGANQATQQIFYGLAIVTSVAIYGRGRRIRDNV
jgi:ribose transport system permease protein